VFRINPLGALVLLAFTVTMCGQCQNDKGPVPADGILQGSVTSDEQSGGARDVTYSWRLVPEN
jgi:hypothetical protein